jgi:hypothetical protein
MKHNILISLASALLMACSAMALAGNNDDVLRQLDKVIADKELYISRKEASLSGLKQRLGGVSSLQQKYDICTKLFNAYLHYQADSAMNYINRKIELSARMGTTALHADEISINRAEALGVMGMYTEAFSELRRVDHSRLQGEALAYYYRTCRACYGWLADYTLSIAAKDSYQKKTCLYRDSILQTIPSGAERDVVWAEQKLLDGDSDMALQKLLSLTEQTARADSVGPRINAYLYYTLSEVYAARSDRDRQIYYLALTSMADLKASVREYASLQKLAQLMYETGDVGRAYSYLIRSMEDAVNCNARLRFIEVSQFFPIIDKAHDIEVQRDHRITRIFLVTLSLLGAALIVLVFFLYRWMTRLKQIRRYLSQTNSHMYDINKKLEETGRIKDVYIARYLDRCASYLNKLDSYRHSLVKFAMASRVEELFKAIKSDEFINEERRAFYSEFDKSFLELFPGFVGAFNNLLADDARITPKPGELLTIELRIFALIRLGVTDSSRIASFLGYSLTTIYNYRSKMRHRAKGSADSFEQEVMQLCATTATSSL